MSGLSMAKSENLPDLNDTEICPVVSSELAHFNNLIKGHRKILEAIAKL